MQWAIILYGCLCYVHSIETLHPGTELVQHRMHKACSCMYVRLFCKLHIWSACHLIICSSLVMQQEAREKHSTSHCGCKSSLARRYVTQLKVHHINISWDHAIPAHFATKPFFYFSCGYIFLSYMIFWDITSWHIHIILYGHEYTNLALEYIYYTVHMLECVPFEMISNIIPTIMTKYH